MVGAMSIIERLTKNASSDVDLLRKNYARGDDLTKPRVVDFLLVADDPSRAELIKQFVTDHHFGEATVQSVDIGCWCVCTCRRRSTSSCASPGSWNASPICSAFAMTAGAVCCNAAASESCGAPRVTDLEAPLPLSRALRKMVPTQRFDASSIAASIPGR
jgi:hypothetical protein